MRWKFSNILLVSVLAVVLCSTAALAKTATVGVNFTGTVVGQSGVVPPDTVGAVGSNQIVEFTNGRYVVFDKTGGQLQTSSLDGFWANSGLTTFKTFDPRVVYDKSSQRWFAAAADRVDLSVGNNFLLAVSNSSNPTAGWKGFSLPYNSSGSLFVDFPSLGLDAKGVYLAANMFTSTSFNSINIVSIPKADLTQAVPTVANAAAFQSVNPSTVGFAVQPAVSWGPDNGRGALLAVAADVFNVLNRTSVLGAGGAGATLSASTNINTPLPTSFPPTAQQPGPKANIYTGDDRFSGSVHAVGTSLWATQSVNSGGRAAIRWYEINEVTNAVLQSGTIGDTGHDYFYPTIAANELGDVVIGFNRSAKTEFASSYAVVGETIAGSTTFGAPMLLKAGVDDYQILDRARRNRWGDYSATVADPDNPLCFWTFQEWADYDINGIDQWATQITQICLVSPVPLPPGFWLMASGLIGIIGLRRKLN